MEASPEKLIPHLYFLLSQSSTELELERKENVMRLKLKSKLDNLPFVWRFDLLVEFPEKVFLIFVTNWSFIKYIFLFPKKLLQYVVRPLLAMLREDFNIQEELCTIIRNKDKEIDDYKASGAAIPPSISNILRHLKCIPHLD